MNGKNGADGADEADDIRSLFGADEVDAVRSKARPTTNEGSAAKPQTPVDPRSTNDEPSVDRSISESGDSSSASMRTTADPAFLSSVPSASGADPSLSVETSLAPTRDSGLSFGSYGRVSAGTNVRGSTPERAQVVAHGSRVVENSYLELDLYYKVRPNDDLAIRLVSTPALTGDLFHYSGDFSAELALRNLFAEATFEETYVLWAGSRMVRGDDMYLLDFWPIDGLNVVGGGAEYKKGRFESGLSVGVNRLLKPFQFQQINVSNRLQGADSIVQLDRQRFVGSMQSTYRLVGEGPGFGMKAKGVVEVHGLPSGEFKREDLTFKDLPGDFGLSIGGQLGVWGFGERDSHVNLFARLARGLAAFDELDTPSGLDEGRQSFPGAAELLLGVSGNYEQGRYGVMFGSYVRGFKDADRNGRDEDDYWEGILDVRPYVAMFDLLQVAVDLSYQQRLPRGPSPTMLEVTNPAVAQIAPMIVLSPYGAGSYARPQVRLVYSAAYLNEGARDLYPAEDVRHDRVWNQFLGVQAEWWFNSTYR